MWDAVMRSELDIANSTVTPGYFYCTPTPTPLNPYPLVRVGGMRGMRGK